MHRKTQLILSGQLLSSLSASPEMAAALEEEVGRPRRRGTDGEGAPGALGHTAAPEPAAAPVLARAYERLEERGAIDDPPLYFLTGSINKNVRSLALDGEVMAAVSGSWALAPVVDFLLLAGGTTWVREIGELEALLPPYPPLQKRIARWLYPIL